MGCPGLQPTVAEPMMAPESEDVRRRFLVKNIGWVGLGCMLWCGMATAEAGAPTHGGDTLKDGPFVGYVFGKDVESNAGAIGYQVTYERNAYLSVELSGSYHEDRSVEVATQVPAVSEVAEVDLDVLSFALTARIGFQQEFGLYPYLAGGIGYYVMGVDNEKLRVAGAEESLSFIEANPDHAFGSHLAVGIEYPLHPNWQIFAEFREIFLSTDVKVTVNPGPDGQPYVARSDLDYDHRMLRLGVNYRF